MMACSTMMSGVGAIVVLPSSAFSVSLASIDVVAKRAIVIPTRVLQLKIFMGVLVKTAAEQAERERER